MTVAVLCRGARRRHAHPLRLIAQIHGQSPLCVRYDVIARTSTNESLCMHCCEITLCSHTKYLKHVFVVKEDFTLTKNSKTRICCERTRYSHNRYPTHIFVVREDVTLTTNIQNTYLSREKTLLSQQIPKTRICRERRRYSHNNITQCPATKMCTMFLI